MRAKNWLYSAAPEFPLGLWAGNTASAQFAHPDPAGKIQRQVSVLSVSEPMLDKVHQLVLYYQLGNERDRTEYQLFVPLSVVARDRDQRAELVGVVVEHGLF